MSTMLQRGAAHTPNRRLLSFVAAEAKERFGLQPEDGIYVRVEPAPRGARSPTGGLAFGAIVVGHGTHSERVRFSTSDPQEHLAIRGPEWVNAAVERLVKAMLRVETGGDTAGWL